MYIHTRPFLPEACPLVKVVSCCSTRGRESVGAVARKRVHTVFSNNFNLRIFKLSLKSEQINCGCFFDTMSDFNVPGSRPKKTR